MKPHNYLLLTLALISVMTAACYGWCVYADPYRLFGSQSPSKPRIYQQAVMTKTYQMERIRPRTLLLGNSRVENGFDPQSSVFSKNERPVFNAGLAGYDLFMAWRLLQDDVAVSPPKLIIAEVDFPDFLGTQSPSPLGSADEARLYINRDGTANTTNRVQRLKDVLTSTLSLDALYDSTVTVLQRRSSLSVTMSPLGFNPLREYLADVRNIGYYGFFVEKMSDYTRRFYAYPHSSFAELAASPQFTYLSNIISIARRHNCEVILFVPPYHSTLLDLFRKSGLWPSFEAWKREVVRLVQDANNHSKTLQVKLVDFSSYNRFTTELVPPKGDYRSVMRWYWEPGHFKAALGDEVLRRLLGKGSADQVGRELNSSTIEEVLAEERRPAGH